MQTKNSRFVLFALTVPLLFVGSVFCSSLPVQYTIRVDAADLSGFDVEMRIPGERRTLRVAMAAHPEYDDRYYRYIANFSAESAGRKLAVTKPEDAVWHIEGGGSQVTVRYRLTLPSQERAIRDAWKPYLMPTGGMVGDLHSLMYVVGGESLPARLTLEMPSGWKAASGLKSTSKPNVFTGSTELMLDAPVVVGDFREWEFTAAGVPHKIVLWSAPNAKAVDAEPIVDGIKKLTDQAIRAFGRPPYPRYAFLLQNGGSAALEHATSLNAGLAIDLIDTFDEIAHEYVHVWNLMDVRPRERIGVRYRFAEPTNVLWWSEGATIMFSDLLIRRAGLSDTRRSRIAYLESILARYFSSPGYSTLSAELVSRADSHPQLIGDNFASTHLQGQALTVMLDLQIRSLSGGRRKLEDVQRSLSSRFNSRVGIDNSDIRNAIENVCRCDMQTFFREHILGAKQMDFNHYLRLIGMRADVTWAPAVNQDGKHAVDLRVWPLSPDGEVKLRIAHPNSAWARAGLRSGDKLVSADGKLIPDWPAFRNWLRQLKMGDTGRLTIVRDGTPKTVEVPLRPYDVPTVRLAELSDATPTQIGLRNAWINAN